MIRAAILAVALVAAAPALAAEPCGGMGQPACPSMPGAKPAPKPAQMECARDQYGSKSCVDREAMKREHVALFCRFHPTDANCQKLGWHPTTDDPVEQAVDRRLVEHFCAASPTLARCISPFGR